MNGSSDLLAGLVLGGVLGFVAGVLVAPAPGYETREKITEKSQEAVGQAREGIGTAKDKAERLASTAREKVKKTAGQEEEDVTYV